MRWIRRGLEAITAATGMMLIAGCSAADTAETANNAANAVEPHATRPVAAAPIVDDITVVDVKGPSSRRYVAGQVIGPAPIRLGPGDAITLNVDGLIYKYVGPGIFTPGQLPPKAGPADGTLTSEEAPGQLRSFVDDSGVGPGEPGYSDYGSGGSSADGSGGDVGSEGAGAVAVPEAAPGGSDADENEPPQ